MRVIYISQGIDSDSDQADALVTVHGLVDSLYLKETAKKIKRGLGGQLERGSATGARPTAIAPKGFLLARPTSTTTPSYLVNGVSFMTRKSKVVRHIFEWAANGIGVFTTTRQLQESVPGPWGRPWTQGTIRRILQNEVYLGKLIWGRVNYERQPHELDASEIPLEQAGVHHGRRRWIRRCGIKLTRADSAHARFDIALVCKENRGGVERNQTRTDAAGGTTGIPYTLPPRNPRFGCLSARPNATAFPGVERITMCSVDGLFARKFETSA